MTLFYILGGVDGKTPVKVTTIEWAQFLENNDRIVAQTRISKKTWIILKGFLAPILIMLCWFLFLSAFLPSEFNILFLIRLAVTGSLVFFCGGLIRDAFSSDLREGTTLISTVFLGLDHRFIGPGPPRYYLRL